MKNETRNEILILAPHLEFPTRNGADIYVERLTHHLGQLRDLILLSKDRQITYRNGSIDSQVTFKNEFRSKTIAAIRTIFFQSHYLGERFLTEEYQQQAQTLLQKYPQSNIICSFLSTNQIVKLQQTKKITLTHNDEILWFQNQRKFTYNLLHKWVAWQSEIWIKNFFREQARNLFLAHICQSDFDGYKKLATEHLGIVVPAGVEIHPLPKSPPFECILRLLFVGSLSVKMNYDALLFFRQQFWPHLKDSFGSKIEFVIAGSNPSDSVQKLAYQEQWPLFANLEDDDLQDLYQKATFAVLPFPYTTGTKLKLLNAMSHGLPVLGTTNMLSLPEQDFFPSLYSDSSQDWVTHLSKYVLTGISQKEREKSQGYAVQFSWEKISEQFERELNKFGF
jgi:glycosyltransferase involved in cell wall biosynthesis